MISKRRGGAHLHTCHPTSKPSLLLAARQNQAVDDLSQARRVGVDSQAMKHSVSRWLGGEGESGEREGGMSGDVMLPRWPLAVFSPERLASVLEGSRAVLATTDGVSTRPIAASPSLPSSPPLYSSRQVALCTCQRLALLGQSIQPSYSLAPSSLAITRDGSASSSHPPRTLSALTSLTRRAALGKRHGNLSIWPILLSEFQPPHAPSLALPPLISR